MPSRDRSGPMGRGARTGKGFGLCSEYGRAGGFQNSRMGQRGMPSGRGMAQRNRGRWFSWPFRSGISRFGERFGTYADPDPELEKQTLQQERDELQAQLNAVQGRLAAMEKPTPSPPTSGSGDS